MKRASTLAEQVRRAQAEYMTWPKKKRAQMARDWASYRALVDAPSRWPKGQQ